MPIQTILDNTYYIFDSGTTALPWNSGSRLAQIRIFAVSTAANVVFNVVAGTPFFTFNYLQTVAVNSGIALVPSMFVFPMGGMRCPSAIIPTTLTAATAWIDFL